jgi:hypothetical protein
LSPLVALTADIQAKHTNASREYLAGPTKIRGMTNVESQEERKSKTEQESSIREGVKGSIPQRIVS